MRRTVPPSAEIEEQIDKLLAVGVGENPRESLSELAKLGARLIIQRAVEDEFDAWLGRARYERRPGGAAGAAQRVPAAPRADRRGRASGRDPAGPRGGRAVRLQAVPAWHQAVAHRAAAGDGDRRVRARPVDARRRVAVRAGGAREALEIDRSRGSAAELRERFEAFGRRDLYDIQLAALFLDAIFLAVRPRRAQGGRAGRLGLHRGRRAGAAWR